MTLRFGKYKGQEFENTPKSYQNWLLKQDWFKSETNKNKYSNFDVEYHFCQGTDQDLENFRITDKKTGKVGNYYFDAGEHMTKNKVINMFCEDLKNNRI